MYYVGIDGGGTTSDFLVLDESGKLLKTYQSGPSNIHSHGFDQVFKNLEIGMREVLCDLEVPKDQIMVTLASAGVDQEKDIEAYNRIFSELNYNNILVVNDGIGALSAGTQGQDGIIVIAGTGSIVFGKKDEIIKRIGGWGHILGDEGSAYKIAIEAIKSAIHYSEGYGKESTLYKALAEAIGIHNTEDYIEYIYQSNKSKDQIASLARIVDEQSLKGDLVATEIIKNQAKEISLQVKAMYKRLFKGDEGVKLIMNGSVIKNSKIFYEAFEENLKAFNFDFKFLDSSAALGAAYLGKKQVENEKSIY
jgi:N-acetylglucosamine kinase-like BadF-type ATPase